MTYALLIAAAGLYLGYEIFFGTRKFKPAAFILSYIPYGFGVFFLHKAGVQVDGWVIPAIIAFMMFGQIEWFEDR